MILAHTPPLLALTTSFNTNHLHFCMSILISQTRFFLSSCSCLLHSFFQILTFTPPPHFLSPCVSALSFSSYRSDFVGRGGSLQYRWCHLQLYVCVVWCGDSEGQLNSLHWHTGSKSHIFIQTTSDQETGSSQAVVCTRKNCTELLLLHFFV